ncbi:MAG: sporulation transcriptional regulator SpoIIID [Bacillota bacterium]|nr:sporulation transcriptional regulator SpoIIID [Bacillota bacterium]
MRWNVEERCVTLANFIIENGATVRKAAKRFGISKSTVHKDITERLRVYNHSLYNDVKKVLELNKCERHLRGGAATREKYKKKSETAGKLN